MMMFDSTVATPFGHSFYVMAKPVGSSCNLHCSYCYYLSKATGRMDLELLETFIRQNFEAQTTPEVLFTWHGGEPLLLPISYYEKALALQQKYAKGRHVDNCLQTNGTLLTDEWCAFFHEHHFLIGISVDGPEWMHDTYRQQFEQTLRGIRLLQKHRVEWNAMATVNRTNADHPDEFYHFFKELGCKYLQFTPVVISEDLTVDSTHHDSSSNPDCSLSTVHSSLHPSSVQPEQWGDFLIGLYDEWIKEDVGKVFVQLFDATLASWLHQSPGVCSMSAVCGLSPALQPDGSLYSCDHFVFPEHLLGNIRQHTIVEMMYSEQQQSFARAKLSGLSKRCRRCSFLFACHGECPRNRFLPGHENYLCEGYRRFFEHVEPTMDFMAAEVMAGRAPANVMRG